MPRIRHHLRNAFIPHHGNEYRPHALRRPWLRTYAAIMIAVKVVTVVAISLYASEARVSDVSPSSIVSLTNKERQQRKLTTLKTNPLLTKAAEAKANDMARKEYFAHVSPKGTTPWYWFKQAGYTYTYAGENLALDFVSSEDVMAAWLRSPSHRSNVLSTKYKDIGVAVVTANMNGATSLIVVQMFGAPTPATSTKKVTVPAQTPSPAQTKQTATGTPVPAKVLGESAQASPVAPDVPTILTPDAGSLVRTARPEIVGQAEPGSTVTLLLNGIRVATATADVSGVYTLVPGEDVSEGNLTLQTTATARGLTSDLSPLRTVIVDTQPPAIEVQRSVALPSYLIADGYDAVVQVEGQPATVQLSAGGTVAQLVERQGVYSGTIQLVPSSVAGVIRVQAVDTAGNRVQSVFTDTDLLTTGVVSSSEGPIVSAIRFLFFSRAFLGLFLVGILVLSLLNIFIHWRHQHHPTIIATLLVLVLGGTLLIV